MKKVVIIGAGPHSKVIIDILTEANEYEIVGLTDQISEGFVLGYKVLGTDEILPELKCNGVDAAFVALGSNRLRKKMFDYASRLGFEMINAISKKAVISRFAKLGKGLAIMPGAVVNASSIIGNGCIINTNSSIDHDCRVSDFVHIAPGCAVSGTTFIGEGSFLGTGSRVIDKINIGKNVLVGSGGVVVKDIVDNCEVVGIPAKVIKSI